MPSLRTASITALALLAALIGASVASATKAKGGVRVEPAQSFVFVMVPASNGWHLQLTADVGKKGSRSIGVYAQGPHGEEVSYGGVEAHVTYDGTIEAKVPGLLHVSLKFEPTSETRDNLEIENCKLEGQARSQKGVFRGTIAFHGEGGYATVKRRSAHGLIEVHPRATCHRPKPPQREAEEPSTEYLQAIREEKGGDSLTFSAFGTGLKLPGSGPITNFNATYTHRRGKLSVSASTEKLGEEEGLFSLTAPNGMPTEATVTPPAPFSGSATFKLESPTTASWTGDLSVEIPTLGKVRLAEPGWWAGACAAICTKTFPPGLTVGFFETQTIH